MNLKKTIRNIIAKKKDPGMGNAHHFITEGSDKLSKEERKKISDQFKKEGLDGNGRFVKIDHAISKISGILSDHGIEMDEVMSSDRFRHDSGRDTFNIARKTNDPFAPQEIKNSMVSFSWYLTGSPSDDKLKRKYEITAYMS